MFTKSKSALGLLLHAIVCSSSNVLGEDPNTPVAPPNENCFSIGYNIRDSRRIQQDTHLLKSSFGAVHLINPMAKNLLTFPGQDFKMVSTEIRFKADPAPDNDLITNLCKNQPKKYKVGRIVVILDFAIDAKSYPKERVKGIYEQLKKCFPQEAIVITATLNDLLSNVEFFKTVSDGKKIGVNNPIQSEGADDTNPVVLLLLAKARLATVYRDYTFVFTSAYYGTKNYSPAKPASGIPRMDLIKMQYHVMQNLMYACSNSVIPMEIIFLEAFDAAIYGSSGSSTPTYADYLGIFDATGQTKYSATFNKAQ